MMGEIALYAFAWAPVGWTRCDGSVLPIRGNESLFMILQTRFGGDGQTTFALPNYAPLRSALHYQIATAGLYEDGRQSMFNVAPGDVVLLTLDAPPPDALECNGQPGTPNLSDNVPPGSKYYIAVHGDATSSRDPMIGQVRVHSAASNPDGWLPCDGRMLRTDDYQPLFSLIEYASGGGGDQFALPDLRQITPPGVRFDIAYHGWYPARPS